jgi:hypothetical protein
VRDLGFEVIFCGRGRQAARCGDFFPADVSGDTIR